MIGRVLAVVLLVISGCSAAQAQAGFYLPTAPSSAGQDEFHASDGTACRTTMDGTKRVEVGSYGTGGDNLFSSYGYGYSYGAGLNARQPTQKAGGVYARFSMSLDSSGSRMDCNKLYELELERRRLEIEIMKRSLMVSDQKLDDLKRQDVRQEVKPEVRQEAKPDARQAAGRRNPPRELPREARSSSGLRGSFPPL